MFDIFFGWRKASKCKKLIKRVKCRLRLLKNKRSSIVRQLREDLAQLIQNGYEQTAFDRVEQLVKDESIMTVYELLDNFCDFIITNLSYIRKHKDCPNDINEAVSSLIFASARCGDLPELQPIRKLFGERYGQRFALTAVEPSPENLVNKQIKEKLCIKSVSDDEKHRLVDEIAKDCLQPQILALEYSSEWHQKQLELHNDLQICYDITDEPQAPNSEEAEGDVLYIDSSLKSNNLLIVPYESHRLSYRDSDLISTSGSTEGDLPRFSEDTIIYLDDVVEFHSPSSKDCDSQDQRLFKFTSPVVPRRENVKQSYADQSWSERSSSKASKKSGKRSRIRTMSMEDQCIKDIECITYYAQPLKSSPTQKHRSQYQRRRLTKMSTEESERLSYAQKSSKEARNNLNKSQDSGCSSHEIDNCSLEHPCYFCPKGDKDDCEKIPTWKQKTEMRRRTCEIGATAYNVFTYAAQQSDKKNEERNGCKSEKSSNTDNQGCLFYANTMVDDGKTRNENLGAYGRAVTMPLERPKDGVKDGVSRSNSCPYKHPNHVHPKLPDYDDIAAKFMALKREHLQNKHT